MKALDRIDKCPPELARLLAEPTIGVPPGGAANDLRGFLLDPEDAETEVVIGRAATFAGHVATAAGLWSVQNFPEITGQSFADLTQGSNHQNLTITVSNMPASAEDVSVFLVLPTRAFRGVPHALSQGGLNGQLFRFSAKEIGPPLTLDLDLRHLSLNAMGNPYVPQLGDATLWVRNDKTLLNSNRVTIPIV